MTRPCDACDHVDDLPRHVFARRNLPSIVMHLHCCAALGCETCRETEK